MLNNNDGLIGKWISILYRYGQSYISRRMEPYNIGCGQYIFLMTLYKKDGISQEELSDLLKIDKATTAKALKKLEEEGYIVRNVDSDDKRAYRVYVTQKALDIKPDFINAIDNWNNILSSGITAEEKEIILKLLKKMTENALAHDEWRNDNEKNTI